MNDEGDNVERTVAALGSLAWPISQGAICTIAGVLALAGTTSYLTQAFFRTVFLVMVIGYVHAIIFLPIALSELSFSRFLKIFKRIFCENSPKKGKDDEKT